MRKTNALCAVAVLLSVGTTGLAFGQTVVQLEVRLVRADVRGGADKPVTDMKVWLFPSSGTPLLKTPDNAGIVRFSFPETAYVAVRVGTPPNGVRLQQMSGRYNQSTSAYFDGAQAGGPLESVEQFLEELRDSARGVELPDSMKKEIRAIQKTIGEWNAADADDVRRLDRMKKSSEVLLKPWKLGIGYKYDVNGATITKVADDSPAMNAGIGIGDRIIEVDDVRVGAGDRGLKTLQEVFGRSDSGRVVIKVEKGSGKESFMREIQLRQP